MTKTFMLLAVVCVCAGCTAEKVETVAWYKEHEPERRAILERCTREGGKAATSQNCLNADQAEDEKQRARRGFLKLPSLDQGRKGRDRG